MAERLTLVRTKRNHERYTKMIKNPLRTQLAGYYGERAIAEMKAGRHQNARRYMEVAWHHALEMFGRRQGTRQGYDNIAFCSHEETGELL